MGDPTASVAGSPVIGPDRTDRSVRPPTVRLLRFTALVSTVDRFAMPPMLLTVAGELHAPLAAVVTAAGTYYLAYGLMQPVWGAVFARLGAVRTIRITLLAAALGTGASAAAQNVLWLAATRALAGGCFGAAIPGCLVHIGDTVPADRRQRVVTDLMGAVALGTAVSTAGAGLLATVGWRWPFVLTGALAIALSPALARIDAPGRPPAQPVLAPLRLVCTQRVALLVLAVAFVEGAVVLGMLTFLPPALESTGLSASLAGAVTAVFGLTVLLAARVVGWLSVRVSGTALVATGVVAISLGCAIAWAWRAAPAALCCCLLLGVGWAFGHSTLQTWATEVVPGARAMAVALFAGALFAGSSAASALGSGLADQGRYPTIFGFALTASVPLGVAAVVGRFRWSPPTAPG